MVNDLKTLSHDEVQKELLSTKGIIFHLAGGNEISFEIGTWFSEMITICRGYELIKQFTPLADLMKNGKTAKDIPLLVPVKSFQSNNDVALAGI